MAFPMASATDRQEIINTINTFMSGIRLKNAQIMLKCTLPGSHACLLRNLTSSHWTGAAAEIAHRSTQAYRTVVPEQSNENNQDNWVPLTISVEQLVARLPISSPDYEGDEVIDEDKTVVCADGDFATAFTPYNFIQAGKLHHTGSNSFSLMRIPQFEVEGIKLSWIITGLADVARNLESNSS